MASAKVGGSLSGASSEYQKKLQQKNFVQRFNQPEKNIKNPDGSVSTHKMATAEVDGMQIAFPTIVEQNGELVELPINEAIDFALKNNEFAEFANAEDAQAWANGGYKRGTKLEQPVNTGGNQLVLRSSTPVSTAPSKPHIMASAKVGKPEPIFQPKPLLPETEKVNPFTASQGKPEVRKQKRDFLTEAMKVDVTEPQEATKVQPAISPVEQQAVEQQSQDFKKVENLVYQEATKDKRVDQLDDNVDARTYGDAAIEDYFEAEKALKTPQPADIEVGGEYASNRIKELNAVIAQEKKYRELMAKDPKDWDIGDQKFMQETRQKAISKKAEADSARLDILEYNTDFDGFNKAMVDLAAEKDVIDKETEIVIEVARELNDNNKRIANSIYRN